MSRTLLALLVILLLAPAAGATVVVRVGVDDMTDLATVIVRGEVLEVKARWTEDKRTINTYVRIRVEKTLKGYAGTEVTACCLGGQVGEDRVPVSGVPEFKKGEKVVVFLWKNKLGDYLPLGQNQGKFRIEKDAKTGETRAKNSLEGLAFVAGSDGKGERRKIRRKPDSFRLADLEKKVLDRIELKRKEAEAAKAKAEKEKAEAKKKEAQPKKPVKEKEKEKTPVTESPATPEKEPAKKDPEKKKRPGEERKPDRP